MISKKIILLFMIVCTIGISSGTLQNAQAFSLQDTSLGIGLCYTLKCFLDSGHIDPVDWKRVLCAMGAVGGGITEDCSKK